MIQQFMKAFALRPPFCRKKVLYILAGPDDELIIIIGIGRTTAKGMMKVMEDWVNDVLVDI